MAKDTAELLQAEYNRILPFWEAAWKERQDALFPILTKGKAIAAGSSRANPTDLEHERLDQALAGETELRRQLDNVIERLRRL